MVLTEAGLLPQPERSDTPIDFDQIEEYLIKEFHISPLDLGRMTVTEIFSLLPRQKGYANPKEGWQIFQLLQKLTPEQRLRIAVLLES